MGSTIGILLSILGEFVAIFNGSDKRTSFPIIRRMCEQLKTEITITVKHLLKIIFSTNNSAFYFEIKSDFNGRSHIVSMKN